LLEIRHYLRVMDALFDRLKAAWPLTPTQLDEVMEWYGQFLPPDPELPARYASAVSSVAAIDPFLGFRLRNKDAIPMFLLKLRGRELRELGNAELRQQITIFIQTGALDAIDEGLRDVAWRRGPLTWLRTRLLLRKPMTFPKEIENLFAAHTLPPTGG